MLHSSLGSKAFWLLLAAGALLSGCTMGTTVTGNVPTGVFASTRPPSSIEVSWTRDPTDLTADTVILLKGGVGIDTVVVPYPVDSTMLSGLISGVTYTIIIGTKNGRSNPYPYPFGVTNIPTNVAVTAQIGLTFTVGWTRNSSDTLVDTLIVTTTNGALVGNTPTLIPAGTSSWTVPGLAPGVTYVIIIASATGRSTAISYTMPGVPFNVVAHSVSVSSIGAKWTRGDKDSAIDTMMVYDNVSHLLVGMATATGDSAIVTGLSEGNVYLIAIHVTIGISDSILWMTAERTNGIQIFEYADSTSGDLRGLQLAANGTKAISLTGTTPDFVLANVDSVTSHSLLSFDAGSLLNSSWPVTWIAPYPFFDSGGLNNYYSPSNYFSDTASLTAHFYVIPNDTSFISKGSAILLCRTVDSNFALIEIVPDPMTGQLYSISNGHKFITVNVSYQSMMNQPYAGRGRPKFVKKISQMPAKKPGFPRSW